MNLPIRQRAPILRNAAQATARAAQAALRGLPLLTTPEDRADRLATCLRCDRRTPAGRCLACGCFTGLKARLATESCPLGYWKEVMR